MSVLTDIKNRGVSDTFFVVCDGLKGLLDVVGNAGGEPRTRGDARAAAGDPADRGAVIPAAHNSGSRNSRLAPWPIAEALRGWAAADGGPRSLRRARRGMMGPSGEAGVLR